MVLENKWLQKPEVDNCFGVPESRRDGRCVSIT